MGEIPSWVGDVAVLPFIFGAVWLFYRQIASGKLVPASTVLMMNAQYERIIDSQEVSIQSLTKQNAYLLDSGITTKHAIDSLREAGTHQGAVINDE